MRHETSVEQAGSHSTEYYLGANVQRHVHARDDRQVGVEIPWTSVYIRQHSVLWEPARNNIAGIL